ncbi:MAG: shikimate kinase [Candidatus Izemoplasmataceae bacterium]
MIGLLGKTLKHSLSKVIHESLSEHPYHLIETDDLDRFFKETTFKGLNVTIPYKEVVIDYMDHVSDIVKKTNALNTIVNVKGLLYGYNTDFLAIDDIIKRYFPKDLSQSVLVIGNGATSRSVLEALKKNQYDNIFVYARNPKNHEYSIKDIHQAQDATIIINTTPVGMYPSNSESLPLELAQFPKLKLIFDVVYNPYFTDLIIQAKRLKIPYIDGLMMLVRQALHSSSKFFNTTYGEHDVMQVYKRTLKHLLNITLIGLPFSGKSHYARHLGHRLNKPIIEIDKMIETTEDASIETIFKTKGEAYFRNLEERISIESAHSFNKIISTGGGIIMNPKVMHALKKNSLILYLDLDDSLMQNLRYHSRPHVKNAKDLLQLKEKRHDLYEAYSDATIYKDTLDTKTILEHIEVKIDEIISHQWTKYQSFRD